MNQPIQTVLFDLDGTLLDTAPDLALALNTLLIEHQQQPLPLAQIRPWISLGTTALIRKGFNLDINDFKTTTLREQKFKRILDETR